MLILSRQPGETVNIGDNITVTIMGVKGSQVRIGISAPRDISVHREEVYERVRAENKSATHRGTDAQHDPLKLAE